VSRSGWGSAAKVAALGLALFSCTLATASARAASIVYRCLDAHLGVVYTDVPCKEGAPLEIRAGDADPAALARLERLRDALDQAAVQRLSEERRLAAQRIVPIPVGRDTETEDMSGYGPYYTYPVAGYFPQQHPRRDRDRDRLQRRSASRGGAPSPPYIVPRP
jgi:hypothetical protein